MNAFTVTELRRPGLLSRLIGSQPRENAFVEIRNLLATKPSKELSAADVINILSTYRIARDDAMQELLAIYQEAALFAVRDKALSADLTDDAAEQFERVQAEALAWLHRRVDDDNTLATRGAERRPMGDDDDHTIAFYSPHQPPAPPAATEASRAAVRVFQGRRSLSRGTPGSWRVRRRGAVPRE